jgi:sugar lactone lactonase YvrE
MNRNHQEVGLMHLLKLCGFVAVVSIAGAARAQEQKPIAKIVLPGERLYTESVTSTKDGTLIVGSLGKGNISRIAPGTTRVEEWIKVGSGGLNQVFGVFADEKYGKLWVCSDRVGDAGGEAPALKVFDLKSGNPTGSYPLIGEKGFCNDIAVAVDGTAYITDTHQAEVFMLKPGAKTLELAAQDPLLKAVDGIAFGDQAVLYVNGVTTGKLLRLNLGTDGKAQKIVELKPSRPLSRPDGMRAIGKNRLLLAENGGSIDIVTFGGRDGDVAHIETIRTDVQGATAVTVTQGVAWAAEGKLAYWEDPAFIGKDPGTFTIYSIPLPRP